MLNWPDPKFRKAEKVQTVFAHVLYILLVLLCSTQTSKADDDWSVNIYSAVLTDGSLRETFRFSADFEDSYLLAVSAAKRIGSFKEWINLELEGQIVKHFGDQDHMEFNTLFVGRWLPFPWDSFINTSFAAGGGLSLATETPEIEKRNHSNTSRFLAYLLLELAFSLPDFHQWSLIARIHHRSGMGGLFNDVHGASNAWGLGIKYAF